MNTVNASNAPAIVAPYGQRTEIAVDANGRVARVADPGGNMVAFETSTDGLLTAMTDARGNSSRYTYDSTGRLTRAEDRAGNAKTLARTTSGTTSTVAPTSAEGRVSSFSVDEPETGNRTRRSTAADGTRRTLVEAPSGAGERRDRWVRGTGVTA